MKELETERESQVDVPLTLMPPLPDVIGSGFVGNPKRRDNSENTLLHASLDEGFDSPHSNKIRSQTLKSPQTMTMSQELKSPPKTKSVETNATQQDETSPKPPTRSDLSEKVLFTSRQPRECVECYVTKQTPDDVTTGGCVVVTNGTKITVLYPKHAATLSVAT